MKNADAAHSVETLESSMETLVKSADAALEASESLPVSVAAGMAPCGIIELINITKC